MRGFLLLVFSFIYINVYAQQSDRNIHLPQVNLLNGTQVSITINQNTQTLEATIAGNQSNSTISVVVVRNNTVVATSFTSLVSDTLIIDLSTYSNDEWLILVADDEETQEAGRIRQKNKNTED